MEQKGGIDFVTKMCYNIYAGSSINPFNHCASKFTQQESIFAA